MFTRNRDDAPLREAGDDSSTPYNPFGAAPSGSSTVPPSTTNPGSLQLEQANQLAVRSIDVGAGIINDLGVQREQLTATRSTLQGTRGVLGSAKRTITTMLRRAKFDHCVKKATIFCLIFTILLLITMKWIVPRSLPAAPPSPPPG